MASPNPYQAPVDSREVPPVLLVAGGAVAERSLAVRASLWLAGAGFVGVVVPLVVSIMLDLDEEGLVAELAGAALILGMLACVVGMLVLLAAPRGQRRLAFVLNFVPLLLIGALVLLIGFMFPV